MRLVEEYRRGPNTWGPGTLLGGLPDEELARLIVEGLAVPATVEYARETR